MSKPSHLYVSLVTGIIEEWDWVNGQKVSTWDTGSCVHNLAVSDSGDSSPQDVIYTIDNDKDIWMMTAHRLRGLANNSVSELHIIWKSRNLLACFKVMGNGEVVIASAGIRLIIGSRNHTDSSALKDIQYTWREVECSEWVTSLDVRINNEQPTRMNVMSEISHVPSVTTFVDLVVGGLEGSIFVYQDILGKLIRAETKKAKMSFTQKYHWHRNGVGAVKWSLDGMSRNSSA